MRSSSCVFLGLSLWAASSCCAYDIPQPPKQTPPSQAKLARKHPSTKNATVILSTVCSGAVGAIIGSVFAPQNLARQWVTVSAAGTVLLLSAGVEGGWMGRAKDWWIHTKKKQKAKQRHRHKVEEVVEYASTGSSDDGLSSVASEVEIEEMGQVKPIHKQTTNTYVGASNKKKRDESSSWSSASSGESSSQQTNTFKVNDQVQQPKDRGGHKRHQNLLMFWKRKKNKEQDVDEKPTVPPWSEFASEDTSRGYEEDYGDDDIGEGLGL